MSEHDEREDHELCECEASVHAIRDIGAAGLFGKPQHRALAELGGREVGETDHMVTETLIRGMYEYWRKVMESPGPSATQESST